MELLPDRDRELNLSLGLFFAFGGVWQLELFDKSISHGSTRMKHGKYKKYFVFHPR
jgi:hypothetical protein